MHIWKRHQRQPKHCLISETICAEASASWSYWRKPRQCLSVPAMSQQQTTNRPVWEVIHPLAFTSDNRCPPLIKRHICTELLTDSHQFFYPQAQVPRRLSPTGLQPHRPPLKACTYRDSPKSISTETRENKELAGQILFPLCFQADKSARASRYSQCPTRRYLRVVTGNQHYLGFFPGAKRGGSV